MPRLLLSRAVYVHSQQAPNLLLWPRQRNLALGTEDVAVEIGDPLPAARGDVEIADRSLHVRRNAVPVELRIEVHDIGGRRIAELAVDPGLLELMVQCI